MPGCDKGGGGGTEDNEGDNEVEEKGMHPCRRAVKMRRRGRPEGGRLPLRLLGATSRLRHRSI